MGIFKDMLYTGVRKREAEEEYERTHPRTYRDDYSSSSSRPRKVRYEAYCRICGAASSTWHTYNSPGEAIAELQKGNIQTTVMNNCGRGNHSPATREIEV